MAAALQDLDFDQFAGSQLQDISHGLRDHQTLSWQRDGDQILRQNPLQFRPCGLADQRHPAFTLALAQFDSDHPVGLGGQNPRKPACFVQSGEAAGFGAASSLLALLVSTYFGLEGATLRLRALARRGWKEWGVVEADRIADAELRYLISIGDDSDDGEPEAVSPSPVTASHLRPAASAPRAIGLVPYAGRP